MKEILSLSNVTFSYENETVLENISLSVKEGDFVGIIGKNGSGKSTLLKLILGLKKPNSGTIVKPDNKKIGYVEQLSLNTDSVFPATVQEIVMLGLYSKIGLFKFPGKKHKEMVVSALKMVGMQDYLKKQVTFLSGGQQQKVLIAKALVCNPDILILDEPTTGIDAASEKEFISTLTTLNKTYNKTIILVTHNFDKLVIANKVLKINNKNIIEEV